METSSASELPRILIIARVTVRRLLSKKRLLVLVGLAVISVLVVWLTAAAVKGQAQIGEYEAIRSFLLPFLLPVVSLVLATAALGEELRDGTATNLLLKPISRIGILAGKYFGALTASLLILLPTAFLGHLLAAGRLGTAGMAVGVLGALLVGTLAYCALGLLLSTIFDHALFAGLAYWLVWEGVLIALAPIAGHLSIGRYAESLLAAGLGRGDLGISAPLDPAQAGLSGAVVATAALLIALQRLKRVELS